MDIIEIAAIVVFAVGIVVVAWNVGWIQGYGAKNEK